MTASPRWSAGTGIVAPPTRLRRAIDSIANPVALILLLPTMLVMGVIGWTGLLFERVLGALRQQSTKEK